MNVIYLGDGSYGVEAAAETYFGEPVSKLTVAQDAVIAAIIQAPSTYYLPQYRTNLSARWHYVLNGMVTIGDLSQAQANSMTFPKLLTDCPSYSPPGLSSGCSTTSTQPVGGLPHDAGLRRADRARRATARRLVADRARQRRAEGHHHGQPARWKKRCTRR